MSWQQSTDELIAEMSSAGIRRGFVVEDGSQTRASHPIFERLAAAITADKLDYDRHEACFFELGSASGHLMAGFLHRTRRGQGAGGVRFWTYRNVESFVRDGLRLSRGMGRKNSLAGLWWGGGKGVIARRSDVDHRDPTIRKNVFEDYGRFISGLAGCYVTAEDVGTTPADMAHIHATTRHVTCVDPAIGGSGNPSQLTARGVVVAMEAASHHLGQGDLAGKRIAMQGLGNVARFMIEELLARDVASVHAVDIDQTSADAARERCPDERLHLQVVDPDDVTIFAQPCDVFAPNAVGGILNERTIASLDTPIVCGAANNALADPLRDARALADRNILYVPDFLANRMGIVNCANEQYGSFPDDPAIESHLDRVTSHGVYQRCLEVFARAADSGRTPNACAEELADELALEQHPIWGHRCAHIIRHLTTGGWAKG